jgi:hypothetical protein
MLQGKEQDLDLADLLTVDANPDTSATYYVFCIKLAVFVH